MTLSEDVVDGDAADSSESCTLAHLTDVASSLTGTATRLQQQLSSIEQGLSIAIDTLVVVVVQVLRGGAVHIVG